MGLSVPRPTPVSRMSEVGTGSWKTYSPLFPEPSGRASFPWR